MYVTTKLESEGRIVRYKESDYVNVIGQTHPRNLRELIDVGCDFSITAERPVDEDLFVFWVVFELRDDNTLSYKYTIRPAATSWAVCDQLVPVCDLRTGRVYVQ